jgi:hypothetical protein
LLFCGAALHCCSCATEDVGPLSSSACLWILSTSVHTLFSILSGTSASLDPGRDPRGSALSNRLNRLSNRCWGWFQESSMRRGRKEGRKEGRKGSVLSVRRGWTLWQQQRLHQCSRQDNNNRKSLVLSLLLPISCRIFESFLLLFAFSLTGTAILSEEGALLCCVAWEVSAACIVLIRAYCEKIDRSVQRRRAAGVSILCCFRRRCSYERLVSLRRCSLLCSGFSAIACTQQRSFSTRVYRRHGQGFSV